MIRTLALLLALATPVAAQERPWTPLPSPESAACPGGLCQAEAMARTLARLGRTPVRIVQRGDSHTAAGYLPLALQSRLNAAGAAATVEWAGVVGATLSRPGLKPQTAPTADLIVIAYGTNEGFDDALDPAVYEQGLRAEIARLRRDAPLADVLLLGAPDAMRAEYGGACPGDDQGRWRAPFNMVVVRNLQRRVAADLGVAYWDWHGRMGGDCSSHSLSGGVEPLMLADHVHFNASGADWIAGLLVEDLLRARDRGAR